MSASPLDDLWLLDALLKLPIGHAVPWTSLSGRDQRLLARGQHTHAYEQRGQSLIRKAVPPLTVDLAVVRTTRSTVETLDAMPFGAYAPQALWLDCEAKPTAQLTTEAARFNTGLVHWRHPAGQPQLVVPAQTLTDGRQHTAAGWRFAEHAYARLLGSPGDLGLGNPIPCTTESTART
ncbi:hypothetical protein ACFU96_48035 [Streptomyces sp. NPDC057620]|uniref:hypothetical protein n=1 Tax=Streptomyces sp. NPDC057620 TaxID=3346185 RepID=UPI0036B0AFF7